MRWAPLLGLSLLFCAQAAHSMSPLLGGKSEHAPDDHANQLASFAVGEIGAKANVADLSLVRVAKLSTQVVAGIKYYFELETKDAAGKTRHYEAQVWEKPAGYSNGANVELLKYKELDQAPAGGSDAATAAASHGAAAGGHGDWGVAAQSAVAQINARSNSLYPYELVAVASAAPAGGGADLVLRLKRGDKHEDMAVKVDKREGGRYGLVSFVPVR